MYPILTLTSAFLTLIYVFLSVKVVQFRKKRKVSIGGQGYNDLEMAIRAHGNFAEYVPLTLILLGCAEANVGKCWVLTLLALIFVVGRLLHITAFLYDIRHFKLRFYGMISTFFAMCSLAIYNVVLILLHTR